MTLQTHPTAPRPKPPHKPGKGLIYAGQSHSLAYIYADLQHCGLDYDDQRVFMAALMWSAGRNQREE